MKPDYRLGASKRPITLTLNKELMNQVKGLTDNLPRLVESLFSGYLATARVERLAKHKALESTALMWNDFDAKSGSIADEYSSL